MKSNSSEISNTALGPLSIHQPSLHAFPKVASPLSPELPTPRSPTGEKNPTSCSQECIPQHPQHIVPDNAMNSLPDNNDCLCMSFYRPR